MIRQDLEVGAVVPRRDHAKAPELRGDVVGALLVADTTHLAPLHRVIRELIEADL
jgi:hypothetical protein